jgi:hypothetical protein
MLDKTTVGRNRAPAGEGLCNYSCFWPSSVFINRYVCSSVPDLPWHERCALILIDSGGSECSSVERFDRQIQSYGSALRNITLNSHSIELCPLNFRRSVGAVVLVFVTTVGSAGCASYTRANSEPSNATAPRSADVAQHAAGSRAPSHRDGIVDQTGREIGGVILFPFDAMGQALSPDAK